MKRLFRNRIPLPWIILVLMFLLLPALAYMQYGWLGQLSIWEKERMKVNLDASVDRFSEEFDREISKYFSVFSLRLSQDADIEATLLNVYNHLEDGILDTSIIENIYLLSSNDEGNTNCKKITGNSLQEVPISPFLSELIEKGKSSGEDRHTSGFPRAFSNPPSIVVPLVRLHTKIEGERTTLTERQNSENIIITFRQEALVETLIKPLAEKYFSRTEGAVYELIIRDLLSGQAVYKSSANAEIAEKPDATGNLFSLRLHNMFFVRIENIDSAGEATFTPEQPSDNIVWRGNRDRADNTMLFEEKGVDVVLSEDEPGIWQAAVTHVAGSLERAVEQNRQRNMYLSAGIMFVLASGMLMLAIASSRARSLAQQRLEFVAGVTHELRTPLAVISSAGQNLADEIVTDREKIARYGETIAQEATHLSGMVENVLLFSRINAVQNLNLLPVQLHQVLKKVLDELEHCLKQKNVQVDVGEDYEEIFALGDTLAIESILRNLILNASQYGADKISVRINLDKSAEERVIKIIISDNGSGIPPQEQKKVFKPFYRGNSVRNENASEIRGSGIGLTLAHRLAKAMGGDIKLKSVFGEGSTFIVILPNSEDHHG